MCGLADWAGFFLLDFPMGASAHARMKEDGLEPTGFIRATACSCFMPSRQAASSRTFRPAGTEVFRIAGAPLRRKNDAYPSLEGETMAFDKRPSDDITKREDPTRRDDLTRRLEKEEVLRLAEEQLEVGKREVETGKARVRRFVTEKPVESRVTLHEEHAEIARRAVTDPTALRDVDWSDKVIEVVETDEQAVVTKTARVAEEVLIRREGTDHVETVRDTVRRQQVELERLPRDTVRDLKKPA